jgi:hypothetical protein
MRQENSNVFHGSMQKIEGKLLPHKGHNPLGGKDYNLFGVYATSHFLTAIVYSLSVERSKIFRKKRMLLSYSPNQIIVKMIGCYWTRKTGYVYVLDSSSFRVLNPYECVSQTDVEILQTLVVEPEKIDELITQNRIVLECDMPPKNKIYCRLLKLEEDMLAFTSSLWHRYWKSRG